MIEFPWPSADGDAILALALDDPDTPHPMLRVVVSTPRDQSRLQRRLALAGYVGSLLEERDGRERWLFYHPDGERP